MASYPPEQVSGSAPVAERHHTMPTPLTHSCPPSCSALASLLVLVLLPLAKASSSASSEVTVSGGQKNTGHGALCPAPLQGNPSGGQGREAAPALCFCSCSGRCCSTHTHFLQYYFNFSSLAKPQATGRHRFPAEHRSMAPTVHMLQERTWLSCQVC
jgi:hypothetical protein